MNQISQEQKSNLISLLKKINAIRFGNFVLKDGTTSSVYIDLRILTNFPKEFKEIMDITINYFREANLLDEFDGIIAPPLAGVPLGAIIAYELNKPFYLARLTPKEHGTKKLIEGDIQNKKLMMVDDVITSGGSKTLLMEKIIEQGGEVSSMFVFVNRVHDEKTLRNIQENYKLNIHFLVALEDILKSSKS